MTCTKPHSRPESLKSFVSLCSHKSANSHGAAAPATLRLCQESQAVNQGKRSGEKPREAGRFHPAGRLGLHEEAGRGRVVLPIQRKQQ